MFKSFNTDWLKLALLRIYHSGWTLVILVGLSLLLCNFHGYNAFLVWWMAMSGVVLVGFSIFLGNLPYRLIQPGQHVNKYAYFWSWVVWVVGAFFLALSPVFAKPLVLIWLSLLGALTGVLFCQWVSRKGLLKWIQ